MALPTLKATGGTITTGSQVTIVNTVSAGRALVISKLTVGSPVATNITIIANGWMIANAYPLPANSIYSETGIVIVAGGTLSVQSSAASAGQGTVVAVYGEEVDN